MNIVHTWGYLIFFHSNEELITIIYLQYSSQNTATSNTTLQIIHLTSRFIDIKWTNDYTKIKMCRKAKAVFFPTERRNLIMFYFLRSKNMVLPEKRVWNYERILKYMFTYKSWLWRKISDRHWNIFTYILANNLNVVFQLCGYWNDWRAFRNCT